MLYTLVEKVHPLINLLNLLKIYLTRKIIGQKKENTSLALLPVTKQKTIHGKNVLIY